MVPEEGSGSFYSGGNAAAQGAYQREHAFCAAIQGEQGPIGEKEGKGIRNGHKSTKPKIRSTANKEGETERR